MVICTDSSFLYSHFENDSKTFDAVEWTIRFRHMDTRMNRFELINALRFGKCRRFIKTDDSDRFAADFLTDIKGGRLVERFCDLEENPCRSLALSLAHTLTGGHRGFDVFHLAAAKILGASHFLTFDANQKKLAENEGLNVPF